LLGPTRFKLKERILPRWEKKRWQCITSIKKVNKVVVLQGLDTWPNK
jgi:hypothetical protein